MHSKYFAPIPPCLNLHYQLVLTIFGRCEQCTIDSMVYVLENEVDRWYICLETRLLVVLEIVNKKWCSQRSEDEMVEFLTKTERKKCKITQNILLDRCLFTFLSSI